MGPDHCIALAPTCPPCTLYGAGGAGLPIVSPLAPRLPCAPGERGGAVRHRVAAAGTAQARACTRVGGFPLGAGKLSVVQRVEHATVTGVGGDFGNELRGIVGDMGNGVCDML